MYSIIDETSQFIVIDKAPGVLVHGTGDSINLVQKLRKDFTSEELFPVHRLDRETSGLMVVAKGNENNSLLSKLFQDRTVEKTYLCLSKGKPKKKQGVIKGDMKKVRDGKWGC